MSHRFDPRNVKNLENEQRRRKLPPDKIINEIPLAGDETVADMGAGSGYFTIPLARRVKKVYAVDVEEKMLQYLDERIREEGVDHIEKILSPLEKTPFPDESMDLLFCSHVLHEVEDLNEGLAELKRITKKGGLIAILDWEKKQTNGGPPLEHRISSEEMEILLTGQQMHIIKRKDLEDYYLILAQR